MDFFILELVALTITLVVRWKAYLKTERQGSSQILAIIASTEAPDTKLTKLKLVCDEIAAPGHAPVMQAIRPSTTKQVDTPIYFEFGDAVGVIAA